MLYFHLCPATQKSSSRQWHYYRSTRCTPNIMAPPSTERGALSRRKCASKQPRTGSAPRSSPIPWTGSARNSCPTSPNKQQRPRRTATVRPEATFQNSVKTSGPPSNPLRPNVSQESDQCFSFQRTRRRLAVWRKLGAPPRVLSWLSRGAPLLWDSHGPPPSFDHRAY